jgi:hypothetical protein
VDVALGLEENGHALALRRERVELADLERLANLVVVARQLLDETEQRALRLASDKLGLTCRDKGDNANIYIYIYGRSCPAEEQGQEEEEEEEDG